MKGSRTLSICCALLALLMFSAVPCSAAEEAFSKWKTIPTEDCNLSAYQNVQQSPLYGKSAVFFGDSICNAKNEAQLGYAGRIGNKYGMTFYKEGYSGYAFSAPARSKIGAKINAFHEAHPNETMDYVILEGGTNDAWDQVTLGSISKSFEKADFNTATFAGAVEAAIYDTKEAFPSAIIGFIIIYKMPIAKYDGEEIVGLRDNAKMEPYMNTLIDICEKWRIPYLDFYHDDAFNNTVFKTNTNTYLGDGIHMNSNGYDLISKYIAAWMESPIREQPKEPDPVVEETPNDTKNPETDPVLEAPTPTPDAEEPAPKSNTGKIVAIAAGAAAIVAAIAVGTVLIVKNKKKK